MMPEERAPRHLDALPVHRRPEVVPSRVEIRGLVERPLALTPADLSALPAADLTDDFVCREGWCVPGLHWRGVALSTVLARAGGDASAPWVEVGSGAFSTSLPREQALRALLATHLGDDVLPVEHGGPVRLVVPGGECYTSIKWVDRVEVRAEPADDSARVTALARLRPAQG